jgi:putative colanic acid biosynthesis UDP-glucose lipid carrier transferase
MQNRYVYCLSIILSIVDFLCINAAFMLAYYICSTINYSFPFSYYIQLLITNNLLWSLIAKYLQVNQEKNVYNLRVLLQLKSQCMGVHAVLFAVYIVVTGSLFQLYPFFAIYYTLLLLHLIGSHFTYSIVEPAIKQRLKLKKPIALMGINPTSLQFAHYYQSNNEHYNYENFLDEHECLMIEDRPTNLKDTCDQIKKAAVNGIHDIYIAMTPDRIGDMETLLDEANNQCVRLKFVYDFGDTVSEPFLNNYRAHLSVRKLTAEQFDQMQFRFIKRLFDLTFSLFVIVFLLSWLYPLLALIIKLNSKGPVLFKQYRSGRNNKPFLCYKFRSMKVNDKADHLQATKDDDRITSVGRILRKTSLDELPQFFNVLLGSMSVVGPRPHMLKHTEQYRSAIDKYMVRHYLKPGITGWAQTNGFRGETKDLEQMQKRVLADIWYLENWSLFLDLKIIKSTVTQIFYTEADVF